MFEYIFTRAGVNGGFVVNHPERIDSEGDQIYLKDEIKTALLIEKFIIRCNGTTMCIYFEEELSPGDISILNEVVDNHINNK